MAAVVALAAIAAILAAAFSLGGFGVPTDSSPQVINRASVPFGLLSKTAPNPSAQAVRNHRNLHPVALWFIGPNGRLAPLAALSPPPVTLFSQLNQLLAGPGSASLDLQNLNLDLQTAIPAGTQVLAAKVSGNVATVDLSPEIETASGEPLIQAFAQLTYTATTGSSCPGPTREIPVRVPSMTTPSAHKAPSTPCADKVVFEVDGQRQEVPTATSAQTSQPITRSDYSSLSP